MSRLNTLWEKNPVKDLCEMVQYVEARCLTEALEAIPCNSCSSCYLATYNNSAYKVWESLDEQTKITGS